ncbi:MULTISPECIES: MFS transporter [Mesorhizobium]|uniref:MFS transporter n=1 Tax=Mesorhizobium TaxID=68287 RepID=UPI0007EC71C1|nr:MULTISPECIES: MFS transporter [Mesorhizobium]TPJ43696.1 MFS transporter [Mesorhizobium sp. B2-6-6]ARP68114.1 MFS transporter [Mesorhizobium sp. WSM1497]MCA0002950.1 MFS transporter [Mesorhizobium sp. B264B2A]MCA0009236.1 MFS transporter [Mesorhizobium sp. B264B1B]MCA0013963.1 MFS transporter [Mesorhizobium sp. B294B1A1]
MTESATGLIETVLHGPETPDRLSPPAWGAVISLALGTFGLVAAECLPASVLTLIARDLGISVDAAGYAITATGIAAAISAPTMAIIAKRLDRRTVLWAMMLLQILSNLLVAVGSSLPVLLAARVMLGIALGGFWSISASLAIRLVPNHLLPRAMSIILAGVSVALVCVPAFGAVVGGSLGWRVAFTLTAVLNAVTLLVLLLTMPTLPPVEMAGFRSLLDAAKDPTIKVALLVVLLVASGHFTSFSYIRVFLETTPKLGTNGIWILLLLSGISGFFGSFAGAFLAKHSLKAVAALPSFLMAIAAVSLLKFGASTFASAIAVSVWGFAFGAVPVGLQTWILLRAVPEQAESAAVLMTSTFQVAIAAGAIFGGLLLKDPDHVTGVFAYTAIATLLAALTVFVFDPKHAT